MHESVTGDTRNQRKNFRRKKAQEIAKWYKAENLESDPAAKFRGVNRLLS